MGTILTFLPGGHTSSIEHTDSLVGSQTLSSWHPTQPQPRSWTITLFHCKGGSTQWTDSMEICQLVLACVQLSIFISLCILIISCFGIIESFIILWEPVQRERLQWVQLIHEIINLKKQYIRWLTPPIKKGRLTYKRINQHFLNSKSPNCINH